MSPPRSGTALITGGAQRLGRAMALSLAARGYDLLLHYHHSQAEAATLAAEVKEFGAQSALLQADLSDPEAASQLLPQAQAQAPELAAGLNLLINNASIFYPCSFAETSLQELQKNFQLHFQTPFVLTQAFAAHCEAVGHAGQIVNMLDTQVRKNIVSYTPYLLSKKALTDLTLLSAKALGPRIRVNGIAPGHILEPIGNNPDPSEQVRQKAPLKRTGDVTDITAALAALLDNPYLTGQILWVDGGWGL